ncbi:hypothetical protein KBD81_05095 [Candidatus Woesebacteria bacterium]|nr:hypothetical protein [Candidatus Woesebacteria bacterium]
MDNFRKALCSLGLTPEEVTIYLASLEQGTTTALSLARSSGIPRTTVYLLLESLIQKKLISQTDEGAKKAYIPASPEALITLAQKKKDEMQAAITSLRFDLPQLEAVYNQSHRKPRIMYYEGLEEVSKIYEETLKADAIYLHRTSQDGLACMGEYLTSYNERIGEHMIPTQEIVSDTPQHLAYQARYSNSRNQIRTIPSRFSCGTDLVIYGQKIAFITYKDALPVGILIDDVEIAHFEHMRFIILWDSLAGTIV